MMNNRLLQLIHFLNERGQFSYANSVNSLIKSAGRPISIDRKAIDTIAAESADFLARKYVDKCLSHGKHPFFIFALYARIDNEIKQSLRKTHGGIAFHIKDFDTIEVSNVEGKSENFDIIIAFTTQDESSAGFIDYSSKRIIVVLSPASLLLSPLSEAWVNSFLNKKNIEVPDMAPTIKVITDTFYRSIYSTLSHEITHAADFPPPKKRDVNTSKQRTKFEKLYNEPGGMFYFTTREELKAFLSQIIGELEMNNLDYSQPLESIIKTSQSYVALSYILEIDESDFKKKDHVGKSIAARKHSAKKYLLSSLYTWLEDKRKELSSSSL